MVEPVGTGALTDPDPDTVAAEDTDGGRESGEPARRKAWAPESDDEVSRLLRRLARTPWLVAERDADDIAAVRRNEQAMRTVTARLGWVLVVERDLVRLRKGPPPRPAEWAVDGPPPLVCSWFFLLAAAGESVAPRVGLGQLVGGARAAAAEAGIDVVHDLTERRAIVAALRELDGRGVIAPIDGELERYVHDELAPVLLAVHHTRLAHLLANPGAVDPAPDPQAWLTLAHQESDPARRMRRRLVDDTCVHSADLDPAEQSWLSQRVRGDDGAPLAAAFGLALERRAEGAAFVVPDLLVRQQHELGPFPFPTPGTVGHAALLLCDHAALAGRTDAGPGPGWRTLGSQEVHEELGRLATRYAGSWSAELTGDLGLLTERVVNLLTGLQLLRRTPDWHFAPPTGRWSEPGSAPGRRVRPPPPNSTTPAAPAAPPAPPETLFEVSAP